MRYKTFILMLIVSLLFCPTINSQETGLPKVFEKDSNIYYSSNSIKEVQLTYGSIDSSPALSPNGKLIVFLRKSDNEAYLAVGGEEDYTPEGLMADQVWIISVDGSGEKMLVEDRHSRNVEIPSDVPQDRRITYGLERTIAHIGGDSIKFSPDSKRVYFITSAWVTSGAVHGVNVDGSNEKFITSGSTLDVIYKGKYKGNLITNIHKYFLTGGTYDWWWIVTPDGEEVGPLGNDLDAVDWDFLYFEDKQQNANEKASSNNIKN